MLACTVLALGVNLASYHFDRSYPFHESNPGLYATCDDWIGGVYRNSFGRTSAHLGKIFKWGPVDIEVGLATGYGLKKWNEAYSSGNAQWCPDPGAVCTRYEGTAMVIPLVIPSMKIGVVRVGVVPPVSSKHKGALTFGVEW